MPDTSPNPRAIEFPTEGGLTAHGHFYPPRNRDYAAPAERKTAASGYEPRRTDVVKLRIAEVFNPILD